jgi:hypothetical protein
MTLKYIHKQRVFANISVNVLCPILFSIRCRAIAIASSLQYHKQQAVVASLNLFGVDLLMCR